MGLDIDLNLDNGVMFSPKISNITDSVLETFFSFRSEKPFSSVSIPQTALLQMFCYFQFKSQFHLKSSSPFDFFLNEIANDYAIMEVEPDFFKLPVWIDKTEPLILQSQEGILLKIKKVPNGLIEIRFDQELPAGNSHVSFVLSEQPPHRVG